MDAFASPWDAGEAPGCAGFSAELSTCRPGHGAAAAPQRSARKSARVPVELGAALRQRGATGVSVQIMDLSTDGFRAATHLELSQGTDVWLRLPKLEPFHAKVVWAEGLYIGCAFERPLHPAVLDMVVRGSRRD
ncbi:MAG: PilZ domain-containing protein [Allosphingosinicella sp.]|uniref:PilZ domain-containing protein n=1 Tax=Allosphingosinicella sp. TaxID=2823234 RepID=UPI00395FEE72